MHNRLRARAAIAVVLTLASGGLLLGAPAPAFAQTAVPAAPGVPVVTPTLAPTPTAQPAPPPLSPAPPPVLVTAADGTEAPVFGSQLFTGAFAAARPTKQSDYVVQPGDQIAVRIYGAINVDSVQTVDTSGALFIQGIGPVSVAGGPASQLQDRLTTALRSVYTDAVGVYVDILQGGTVGVFLSGDVERPGRYLGSPGDSVLYFLDRAGGIDPERGSFRSVQVRRNGVAVATFDLYDFMVEGRIAAFSFRDADVIHVGPRGPMVIVSGAAANEYAFEARSGSTGLTGAELLTLARPSSNATSFGVTSTRDGAARAAYYPRDQFTQVQLGSGDHVRIQADVFTETISVSTEGDIRGPSIFVLPRGAMLSQLLQQLPLDQSDVEPTYVHIERPSIAREQKEALDRALDNLERAALTQPAYSADGASTAAAQAAMVTQYVSRARDVETEGKIAVYTNGQFQDIRLQAGDRIILPNRSDVVIVAGEVLSPGAYAWTRNLRIRDYVDRAGGPAPNANTRRYALRRPDGSATVVGAGEYPRPGDQIVAVPGYPSRGWLLFKDLTQVAFQIATTAASVVRLSD